MPPYQWISIEPERHDKGTEEGATKPTKDTRDASLHLGNEEAHNSIGPPTKTLHHEGHVSNVDKWAISPETAQGGRNRRKSTLSTTMIMSRLTSHLLPYHETMWLR